MYVKGTTLGASVKAFFPLMVMPTRTADDPTSTVMVPTAGKDKTLAPCWTPLTRGTGDEELVIWTQHGPEVATTTVNLVVATLYEALESLDPEDWTGNAWRGTVEVGFEDPPVVADDPAGATRRMCALASTRGLAVSSTNPTATMRTSTAAIHVITRSEVGARILRLARATDLRLLRRSARGTTGNVPVGGPTSAE